MQLTYKDAPLEPTELGYSRKSAQRIWMIVSVDDDPDAKDYYGNWLYLIDGHYNNDKSTLSSYETWENELIFMSRKEAQEYIDGMPEKRRKDWHTVNLGDIYREEDRYFDRKPFIPKFRGSDKAFRLRKQHTTLPTDHWMEF